MTHNWKILDLESNPSSGLVIKIMYGCFSNHYDIKDRYINEVYLDGSTDSPEFIQYEELTEDTVLNWVDTLIDKNTIETELSSSIGVMEIDFSSSIPTQFGTPWSN